MGLFFCYARCLGGRSQVWLGRILSPSPLPLVATSDGGRNLVSLGFISYACTVRHVHVRSIHVRGVLSLLVGMRHALCAIQSSKFSHCDLRHYASESRNDVPLWLIQNSSKDGRGFPVNTSREVNREFHLAPLRRRGF